MPSDDLHSDPGGRELEVSGKDIETNWHVMTKDVEYGPFDEKKIEEMIQEGRLSGQTDIRLAEDQEWRPLGTVPIFSKLILPPKPGQSTEASNISADSGATVVNIENTITAPTPIIRPHDIPRGPKSPWVALLLSLLIPGAGQMYNGEVGKGFLFLIVTYATVVIFIGFAIWIWSFLSAYDKAKDITRKYEAGRIVGYA